MILRFEATLGDQKFSDIAPEIILRDIVETPVDVEVSTARWANRPGQRVSGRTRTALSVRLVYVIRSMDIVRRAQIRDLVAAWAGKGGYLTINSRPGKRLYVQADVAPTLDSSLKWTQDLSLTLTAYAVPYWEDETPTTFSISTAWSDTHQQYFFADVIDATSLQLDVPLSATLINSSGVNALTNVKIIAFSANGETHIELDGISVVAESMLGGWVQIGYTDDGLMYIRNPWAPEESMSLLEHRTAESSDDLILHGGVGVQIYVYSDQPISGNLTYRGRYL